MRSFFVYALVLLSAHNITSYEHPHQSPRQNITKKIFSAVGKFIDTN